MMRGGADGAKDFAFYLSLFYSPPHLSKKTFFHLS